MEEERVLWNKVDESDNEREKEKRWTGRETDFGGS